VVEVIDGDTVRLDIDLGLRIRSVQPVRVAHVDAPEMRTAEGRLARAFVASLLPVGSTVTLRTARPDKFGRVLGSITLADGSDLAARLMDAGHASPYEGGAR
jgi:endonuclease YncB( thermonuclease family)